MKIFPLLTNEIAPTLFLIVNLLVFFTLLFWILGLIFPQKNFDDLKTKTYAWWIIFFCYVFMTLISFKIFIISMAALSFIAFRELISKLDISFQSRRIIFWAYLAIPVQYYLIYKGLMFAYLIFIPVGMFYFIPLRAILSGITKDSVKVFSTIYWGLMLTVFGLGHLAFYFSLPQVAGSGAGPSGIILFLVFMTEMNDIFQFICGKLFGRHKISPQISPNKTVEGFIGGLFFTTLAGYFLRNLLPFNSTQTIIASALIAISGFFGDLNMSAIKRDLQIKDMGNFIPGHGGLLDRIDSLLFSAVMFFYLYYYWIYT
ncbi:MAG: phosphatidate cytidylyltransferase [Bdellovibrionales bacterium RIFOXYD12_FULL_39_22]|nr:MAG: phosphatidate cytidylyltransferase [Bdellovibrionales bacterium RIFOXYB1_FULL_39_21]OFZ40613.1 MAG: phosphatidate cytidylyltransferase [Bdellovibrionales bacterium RIFOXYC12_FULL_39_17]OFZ50439.1 MAG: phosphatidate cytidylyltransferase [Bdellovibrionales bacterium RIFOXYC1_FULL_39_130]OFZ75290.1 MAG: phosphatidate cytidylyltransferase [Bdellovibrionales bacterium RIFOXYC2_FULL_39_8]OFZ77698.1 MAG: phosphatidate cytidylyltransferase [Bdellovibrionales bacterium RIFOXYD1_FULL_39_84]OFZ91